MIMVTEDAKAVLNDILTQAVDEMPEEVKEPEPGIRLIVQQGELNLALDHPHEGDEVVEVEGHKVLMISPDLSMLLDGATVGIEHSPEGDRLTVSKE